MIDVATGFGRRRMSLTPDIMFGALSGSVLIMDSQIGDGLDVGFNDGECRVIANDRLTNDWSMIYRLIIECGNFRIGDNFAVKYTMDSAVTDYVDHFSAIKIGIHPESIWYFPGESMTFIYSVTDRLGNAIEHEKLQNTTITLSSDTFTGSLWIHGNGECPLCEEVK